MSIGLGLINTVFFGVRTISIINRVGMDVVIKTVTCTTNSIGSILGHIMTMDQPSVAEVKHELEKIDLEFTIEVLEELINEQKGRTDCDSIKKAIDGVNQILINMENELKTIKEAIIKHNNKFLSYYRTFYCKKNIDTIKKYNTLLKKRYGILIDLLKINDKQYDDNKMIAKNIT